MTWLPIEQSTAAEREAVLGLQPEAYASHRAFLAACEAQFAPALLDVCRARMAQLLACREELVRHEEALLARLKTGDRAALFPASQLAALAFTEQFMLDPSLIDRELVAALEEHLGTAGVINFAAVIAGLEASLRLSALFDLEPAPCANQS